MTPKQQQILRIASVPVAYVLALAACIRLTFPYEMLRDRALQQYQLSQSKLPAPDQKRLEIESLSGSGLFSLKAKGIKLTSVSANTEAGEPVAPSTLQLDVVYVGVSVLSYLLGNLSVDFEAELGGGEVSGSFFQDDAEARLSVLADAIDISSLTLLSSIVGLPLAGELGGSVDLTLPEGLAKKAEGAVDLKISNFSAGDGVAKVRQTIALPKLNAGNLVLKAEVTEGQVSITDFSTSGPDFEMQAGGRLRLREPFELTTASLDVSFKFKEAYTNQNELTKSIFGSPDSKIPALFDMDPTVRRAKKPDGSYGWQVTGLLSKPSFRPGKKTGRSSETETE